MTIWGSGQSDALMGGSDCTFACRKEAHGPGQGEEAATPSSKSPQSWPWPCRVLGLLRSLGKNPASLLQRW